MSGGAHRHVVNTLQASAFRGLIPRPSHRAAAPSCCPIAHFETRHAGSTSAARASEKNSTRSSSSASAGNGRLPVSVATDGNETDASRAALTPSLMFLETESPGAEAELAAGMVADWTESTNMLDDDIGVGAIPANSSDIVQAWLEPEGDA